MISSHESKHFRFCAQNCNEQNCVSAFSISAYTYTCTYAFTYACTCAYTYICTYAYTYTCAYTCTCVFASGRCLSFFLSFFLSFYISCNIMYMHMYMQRWKQDYTFARTTRLNKVIFSNTFKFWCDCNFSSKAIYINYSSHMIKSTNQILKLNCEARMQLHVFTSATDCLLFL